MGNSTVFHCCRDYIQFNLPKLELITLASRKLHLLIYKENLRLKNAAETLKQVEMFSDEGFFTWMRGLVCMQVLLFLANNVMIIS